MSRELERWQLIERSIIKKFHKELWTPFITAVKQYQLIQAGDRIAVCVSGGASSMLLAKLLQALHRHSDAPFKLAFLTIDPGRGALDRQSVEETAALLHVPVSILEADDAEPVDPGGEERRGARLHAGTLCRAAAQLGCNKIALGHHKNDVIETTVMSMFFGARLQAMLPKRHSAEVPGVELIRPLYCVREADILAWARYHDLTFSPCACRFTEGSDAADGDAERREARALLRTLRETNPGLENSIFRSIHAVALDTMPGYRTGGALHSFLENYDE